MPARRRSRAGLARMTTPSAVLADDPARRAAIRAGVGDAAPAAGNGFADQSGGSADPILCAALAICVGKQASRQEGIARAAGHLRRSEWNTG